MNATIILKSLIVSDIVLAIDNHIRTNNLFNSSFLSIHNCIVISDCSLLMNQLNEKIKELKGKTKNILISETSNLLLVCINNSNIDLSVYKEITYSLLNINFKS